MGETREAYQQRAGFTVTDQQWQAWQNDLRGQSLGNPYATMCQFCAGRHGPPRDQDCPRRALKDRSDG